MKIIANDLRVGNIVEHKSKLWVITKTMHTQPGKGGAYIQAEMKELLGGTKTNERFRSSETLEKVHLEEEFYQYLFSDDTDITLMHLQTFEQITLPTDILGERVAFLQDGMQVKAMMYDGKPISVDLPETVIMEIVEAEPVVKGQTASSSYKPAKLENGLRVMVPPHIGTGTRIVVNTADCTYVERAKD